MDGLETIEPADALLSLGSLQFLFSIVALAITLAWSLRSRAKLGEIVASDSPGRGLRLVWLAGPALIGIGLLVLVPDLPRSAALPWLVLAIGLSLLLPGFQDADCGESGVRRGWHTRRFEELEEWRLTGEHLRFKLFGEWTSVPLPEKEHVRFREKLIAAAGDRESPFA